MRGLLSVLLIVTASYSFAEVSIKDATIRALPPGVPNTAVYMTISNHSEDDLIIVGATSTLSDRLELHDHVMKGEMMSMQQQASVTIPSHGEVAFKPGGLHVMVFGLTRSITAGQEYTLSLVAKNGDLIEVVATGVMPGRESSSHKQEKSHHHHD